MDSVGAARTVIAHRGEHRKLGVFISMYIYSAQDWKTHLEIRCIRGLYPPVLSGLAMTSFKGQCLRLAEFES
jgi:hypothetical protein